MDQFVFGDLGIDPTTVFGGIAYFFVFLGGVIINFMHKATIEKLTWKDYWLARPMNTIASFLVSMGLFMSLLMSGQTSLLTYLSVSFMSEALVNRSGKYESKATESDN